VKNVNKSSCICKQLRINKKQKVNEHKKITKTIQCIQKRGFITRSDERKQKMQALKKTTLNKL